MGARSHWPSDGMGLRASQHHHFCNPSARAYPSVLLALGCGKKEVFENSDQSQRARMRFASKFLLFLIHLSISFSAFADFPSRLENVIFIMAEHELWDAENSDRNLAKQLCESVDPSRCAGVATVGEAICIIAKGRDCSYTRSIAAGICKSGKNRDCMFTGSLPKEICRAGGQSDITCTFVSTVEKAICEGSGQGNCTFVTSIPQAICEGGGARTCTYVDSIAEAVCEARRGRFCSSVSFREALSLPPRDTEWKWDQIPDQFGGRVWRCRGTKTGRFASKDMCFGEIKADFTWPG